MDKNNFSDISQDAKLIESLGGVSALAERLDYSVQRVYNWTLRGIPSFEKIKHREILLDDQPNS